MLLTLYDATRLTRIRFIEFLSTLTLLSVVDINLFEFRTVNCSLGTNCDVVADSVTNLSLVGSKVIDIRMTCERDLVLLASCVKNFLADRTI